MKHFRFLSGVITLFCFTVSSCSSGGKKDLPLVDILGGLNRERVLRLSELADRAEYVKLETSPDCLLGGWLMVKSGGNYYIRDSRQSRILVFDKQGKFLRQIGRQGRGPGEYVRFAYWDVSQDNRFVAIGGLGEGVKLYTTNGDFKCQAQFSISFLSGFLFLNSEKLISYEARLNSGQKCYPAMLAWNVANLKADTVLRIDMEVQQSDRDFSLVYTAFYPSGGRIHFMKAANDTLYQLDPDLRITPLMVLGCGERSITEEKLFMTSNKKELSVYPFCETRKYLFMATGKDEEYGIMAFNKMTGETFRLPPKTSLIDGISKIHGPLNDLDGFDLPFTGFQMDDKTWCSVLQISDLKEFFASGTADKTSLRTRNYIDELRSLTDASDLNDNPIIRIIYLK